MDLNSLFLLIGFTAFTFLLIFSWDQRINWEKKNRKVFSDKFFFFFFGFTAFFLILDNWFVLSQFTLSNNNTLQTNGVGALYQWWGILSFILGLFAGIIILSFIYKRIAQAVRRLNIFTFYHYLRVRYPKGKWFVSIISKIGLIAAVPFIYYQVHLSTKILFPALNSYLAFGIFLVCLLGVFAFISNKNQKVFYFVSFIFAFTWIILGIVHSTEQPSPYFFSTPQFDKVGVLAFLGMAYYLGLPRNFTLFTQRKMDALKINFLRRRLIIGSLFLIIFVFFFVPLGGWNLKLGTASPLFILALTFPILLTQLFFLKANVYQSLKVYNLKSRSLSSLIAMAMFLVFVFGCHFLITHFKQDPSVLFLLALTYFPILLPSFVGGFIFKNANAVNFILSYIAGFSVWFYLIIVEKLMQMQITGLNLADSLVIQSFLPFLAALIFFLFPMIFMRKKSMLVSSFTHPEDLIVESFFIELDGDKISGIFSDPLKIQLFLLFFDHKEKMFEKEFLAAQTKIPANRLDNFLQPLMEEGFVHQIGSNYHYVLQEKEVEKKLDKLVASYHSIESMFRGKVEEDFNDYKVSVMQKAEELDTQVSTLTLLNEVAQEFSQVFNFETLYRKTAELAVNNLEFETAEVFLVSQEEEKYNFKPVYAFYSNYQHLMFSLEDYEEKIKQDQARLDLLAQGLLDKELIINNPVELENLHSLPEKYSSMAIFSVLNEGKPFALVQVGFSTEDKSISAQDIQKIEFLVNNISQSVIVISLYESLEDRINQRTAELQKTNEDLVSFNEALNVLDKEIKREMMVASDIQKAIIPEDFPYPDFISVGSKLKAMPDLTLSEKERKRIEISGDYFDVFDLENGRVGILIADVTGHGIPSALITTMSKISFYTHAIEGGSTASICDRVNRDIFEAIGVGDTGFYVTVFFAIYDTDTGLLQYTNAGHHEGIVIKKDGGKIEELNSPGFFIGSFEAAEYGYDETLLKEGDRFILYTDGIIEQRNDAGEFYEDIFYQRINEFKDESCQKMVNAIFKEMEEFRGEYPIKDDRTLLIIEPKSIPNPASLTPLMIKKQFQEEALKNRQEKEDSTIPEEEQEVEQQTQLVKNRPANMEELKQRFSEIVRKFNKKEYTDALEQEVESLLAVYPDPKMLYYIKGFLLLKKEVFQEALDAFLQAEKLMPEHSSTLNYIAYLNFKLKNFPLAAQYWEKVLELKPNLETAKQNLEVVKKML